MGTLVIQADAHFHEIEANNRNNVNDNRELSAAEYFRLPSFFYDAKTESLYLTLPQNRESVADLVSDILTIANMSVEEYVRFTQRYEY